MIEIRRVDSGFIVTIHNPDGSAKIHAFSTKESLIGWLRRGLSKLDVPAHPAAEQSDDS
jgi:hypothetical protein